jgi:asparagine synthase (glutamine-hydrolysing)
MCGIAGIAGDGVVDVPALARMAAALRHRGPDGWGLYTSTFAGLAHTRLSIIDLATGAQPLANEDGTIWITFNGEIYNYRELRPLLEARGHRFRTASDTEVLVHGYEEWGEGVLERLNGQFAFAIADGRDDSVFLARDRYGVRPLFYAERAGALAFASEAKAIFASGLVRAEADLRGLDEVFTFWAARAPRTVFRGVAQLEPGTWARWKDGRLRTGRWFVLEFPPPPPLSSTDHVAALGALLGDAVDQRMRADVPVGAYLSGGLDSSITSALAARCTPFDLRTFSVTFDDPRFDESVHQRVMADAIGSRHAIHAVRPGEIARIFPEVVRHAETPLVRTAPAPLYQLSRLTKEHGIKVVLTGEGADESFLGYDLYKEVVVRLFCLRHPDSAWRPRLFNRLYPYQRQAGQGGELWHRFFLDAGSLDDPLFSHLPRFMLTGRIKDFLAPDVRADLAGFDAAEELRASVPAEFNKWTPLGRAAWLEFSTLLAGYLLSSQGDRMAMAHGVEGRFPYLDHRLVAFAAGLPEGSRLLGLHEKAVLRRWARTTLPGSVAARGKQPYRSPDVAAIFDGGPADVVAQLDPDAVRGVGLFEPAAVAALVRRARAGKAEGVRESQALVAVLSTQLWHQTFVSSPATVPALDVHTADVMAVAESASAHTRHS